jgi:hypothetical protein
VIVLYIGMRIARSLLFTLTVIFIIIQTVIVNPLQVISQVRVCMHAHV